MAIRNIPLSPAVITLSPETSLKVALDFMLERQINHLPILDERGYRGMLDINDILRELIPASARVDGGLHDLRFAGDAAGLLTAHLKDLEGRTVCELGRRDLPALRDDCPLLEAALQLSREDSPLPVLDGAGRLLGMLSARRLLSYLMTQPGARA
jgi:CBS domain-containing protein